jgi:sporulation protein YlmC with PRC-barrel domain
VAGDTGIAIGKVSKTVLEWDSTAVPASFVLNSAATQTGLITEIQFF